MGTTKFLSLLLIALKLTFGLAVVDYSGYQVLSVFPLTDKDLVFLEDEVEKLSLNLWNEIRSPGTKPLDIMVSPENLDHFIGDLTEQNINYSIKIQNVEKLIREQKRVQEKSSPKAFDHTVYHSLDEIYAILDSLETDFPNIVGGFVAGVTYEGRPIRVVEVSVASDRPAVWIDCGIHAREWIGPAFCLWVLDQLTSGYGIDPTVTILLDSYDFYVMPVTNPDGYAYTWDVDRMWRYNRSPNNGSDCIGVDLNRNFDSNFGGVGSSNNPCTAMDIYHGPYAFSEKETQAIRDSLTTLKDRLAVYFAIHSYSQLWMTPYGYKIELPPNYDNQYASAEIGVEALTAVHGTMYEYGNHFIVIYPASGISIDWVYESLNVSYPFLIEVRDTGEYGFLLPPEQIIPVGEETWAGIEAAILSI